MPVEAAEYLDGVTCPSSTPSSPPEAGASDPDLGATINFYNSSDQLTATTDALGNTTTYSYTSGVSGVPNGLEYCSVGPVAYQDDVTCPAYSAAHVSGTTTSTYDSAGDLASSTDPDGDTTQYYYAVSGHPGLVSSSVSPDGSSTSYSYNGAGQVTSQVVSFGSYSATTQYAYDAYGRQFCTVAPYEYANGVTCPSSAPTSPPTPTDDPYLGATITTYDADGRVVQTTNPLGGIAYTAYDEAGHVYCTVAAAEAALGVTCPSSSPSTQPTVGSDSYLGATITGYNASGMVTQVTNPLGGINLDQYDSAGNVLTATAETLGTTASPNVVTSYSYDADGRAISTTVDPGGGSAASTTEQSYDPDGNVYCSVSADAVAIGTTAYQCPVWQAGSISSPPSPSTLYSSTPSAAQANNVTTTFYDADANELLSTDPNVHTTVSAVDGDGRTYCSIDAADFSTWLAAHPSGTYPYLCPSSPPTTAPTSGSNPGYVTTIFDAAGNTMSTTDQAGETTSYSYSPGGQVLTTTNPNGSVTTNCYYYEDSSGACAHMGRPRAGVRQKTFIRPPRRTRARTQAAKSLRTPTTRAARRTRLPPRPGLRPTLMTQTATCTRQVIRARPPVIPRRPTIPTATTSTARCARWPTRPGPRPTATTPTRTSRRSLMAPGSSFRTTIIPTAISTPSPTRTANPSRWATTPLGKSPPLRTG